MKNNKILVRIKNIEEINNYKKESINNFLFPLKDFSIGYNSFDIDELNNIDGNVYLFLNRILDTEDINLFKKIIPKLQFIKGIFFEDIGIYNLLKDTKIPLIWNQSHFVINSESINIWLSKVNSACLSNELTKDEIKYILDNSIKPLILPILGLNQIMYSRRLLLSNYNNYKCLKPLKNALIKPNDKHTFKIIESNKGTILFNNEYYNLYDYLKKINDDKILFYYIDSNDLTSTDIINFINGKEIKANNQLLNDKTIYRIGDLK